MYSFLLPLVIVGSLVGILVIVLRQTPELPGWVERHFLGRIRGRHGLQVFFSLVLIIGQKFWAGVSALGRRLWRFILEAKEIGRPGLKKLPEKISHISKTRLSFFRQSESVEHFLATAEADLESQDYDRAERGFIKAIEKDPRNEQAFAGLGRLYLAQKKFKEAQETYRFLTKHYPENASYHSSLGQALHSLGRHNRAAAAYRLAIELEPDNARRYVNLGLSYAAMNNHEEALEQYRQAMALEPENVQVLTVYAEALVEQGDKEEAIEILEKVLALEPTNHPAREKLMKLKF